MYGGALQRAMLSSKSRKDAFPRTLTSIVLIRYASAIAKRRFT
jgi:hypothetical protein